MKKLLTIIYLSLLLIAGCSEPEATTATATFGDDLAFLKKHLDVVTLSDATGLSQVAIVPAYQGRIMTSTSGGYNGLSYGWINRELISSGQFAQHMNAFGGEDRFWMGPEGGQFSIFFEKGDPFDLEHWFTPAVIDTEPYDLIKKEQGRAVFQKRTRLTNASGTEFDILIDRTIRLVSTEDAGRSLDIIIPESISMVAFQSENKITNKSNKPWSSQTGLLSIWILGMFNPSPETTVVIPFRAGPEMQLGPIVNDTYFGKVPPDRLKIINDAIFFKGDGQYRSKIGLSPKRARPIMGSYDGLNKVLTIIQYNYPKDNTTSYVNSMWEIQEKPFAGDVVNSYNDGPPEPGKKPLGPFYELESSSPARALKPSEAIVHLHRTIHFQGPAEDLDNIAKLTLGVPLEEIKTAF